MRTMLLISAAAALVATPAFAKPFQDDVDQAPTARVYIADLNLSSPEGQRSLKRRVNGAIEQVCGSYAGPTDLAEIRLIDKCRKAAQADAAEQVAMRAGTVRLAERAH